MKDKEKQIFEFKVIDKKTGKEADIGEIALKEDWAKGLMYCDMEGFAILEDGNLVLLDECGKWEYCPSGRFEIIPEDSVVLSREELSEIIKQTKETEKNYYKKVVIPQARKETAEKILNELYCTPKEQVESKIKELARFIGVEIKE